MAKTHPTPTKSQQRRLRKLAGEVYEAEIAEALASLETDFKEWRRGQILPSELNDRIHDYHQEISREIWKQYNCRQSEAWLVARGETLDSSTDRIWPMICGRLSNRGWRRFESWRRAAKQPKPEPSAGKWKRKCSGRNS